MIEEENDDASEFLESEMRRIEEKPISKLSLQEAFLCALYRLHEKHADRE